MVRPNLALIMAYLERVQQDGPERQARFDLVGTQAKLGRHHNNDFVLPFFSVSENHAEFEFRHEQWEVRSLTSGGIRINHESIDHDDFVVLTNNDVISFVPGDHSVDYRFVSCENLKSDSAHATGQSVQSLQPSVSAPSTSVTSFSSSPARANGRKRAEIEPIDTGSKIPKIFKAPSCDTDDDAMPKTQQTLSSTEPSIESPSQRKQVIRGNNVGSQKTLTYLLETAFNCPICIEVPIEPSAGQCGHIFCSHCVTVWTERSKDPSNPVCPLCHDNIGSPTRLIGLDYFINSIYDFVPDETRENRAQILKQRQLELDKWGQRKNTSQIELDGVLNQVDDEAGEASPESDDVEVDPLTPTFQPDDETTRNVRKNDKVKRKKKKPYPDRSFELLFVPVLEGYSPSLRMRISTNDQGNREYCRVKHSVEGSNETTTMQSEAEDGIAETNHVSSVSPNTSGSQALSVAEALPPEQQSSHKKAPLSSDANDWFQAHRFIFRFEDPKGRRLTKRGLNFVRRHIGQFLRAQYGYRYPSTDSVQGNDTAVGEIEAGVNSQSRTQGTERAAASSSGSVSHENSANTEGNSSMTFVKRGRKPRGEFANPIAWEIRTISIPPLVFPLRSTAPSPAPHHIIFTEIDRIRFGELDFPRSSVSRHHLVPSPSPSLASNASVWSDVFAGSEDELGGMELGSPVQFIPEDFLGRAQHGAGLAEHDHLGAVDQHEPPSQPLQDLTQLAVPPSVVDESPPVGSSSAPATFIHPEEHNSRAVSPQLSDRRLEFSVIPPTYIPGITPQYKIIGKFVYDQ